MQLTAELLSELMGEALVEARMAERVGEVPVGAVLYHSGTIIARAHNLTEQNHDASCHAELLAMRAGAQKLNNWRLNDSLLVVTLEPCTMCAGAIKLGRVETVVFGAHDPRGGGVGSLYDLLQDPRTGAPPRVISGVRSDECVAVLREFFARKR